VRLIAQVEAVGAMTSAVGERRWTRSQRFERRRLRRTDSPANTRDVTSSGMSVTV
jgi:hypothetical protein